MTETFKGAGWRAMKTELTVKSEWEIRKVSGLEESSGKRAWMSNLVLRRQW